MHMCICMRIHLHMHRADLYRIIILSFLIMFIHVQFGSERGDYVVEFEKNCFITASDVLEKVRYRCGTCSMLLLFNDHGVILESSHLVGLLSKASVKVEIERRNLHMYIAFLQLCRKDCFHDSFQLLAKHTAY